MHLLSVMYNILLAVGCMAQNTLWPMGQNKYANEYYSCISGQNVITSQKICPLATTNYADLHSQKLSSNFSKVVTSGHNELDVLTLFQIHTQTLWPFDTTKCGLYICIYIYVCVCVCVCVHVSVYVYVCVFMCVCVFCIYL